MRFLLSNELGSKLTCCGKTEKLGFTSLELYTILESKDLIVIRLCLLKYLNILYIFFVEAVLKRHQKISQHELQQPLQSWFRHSKERYIKGLNKK